MQISTFTWQPKQGWSSDDLSAMDSPASLVMLFGASGMTASSPPMQKLRASFKHASIIGCSTAGEILGDSIRDDSLVAGVVKFDNTRLRTTSAPVPSARESFDAGAAVARSLFTSDLRGVIVLSDGLHVNGSQLVAGINSVLPDSVIVTGGLAADSNHFAHTWVISDGTPASGFVSAVGIYGDRVKIGHGSCGGWDIFGPERKVTRSEGNCLYEVDGKPALQLYKEYLGERADELPAAALLFPLALRSGPAEKKSVVRTILSVSEEHQSLTFAGDIPQGSLVQLMRANFDRLIDGAAAAARLTSRLSLADAEQISLAISCVGRRLILGERTEEELEAALESLPEGTQQIGFYSYGEISPYATGHCDLHNQTMTLTTISEG